MRGLPRALLLAALAPGWCCAADKLPDGDLLEFLGSVDADGSDWSEFLGRTNLDKVKPGNPSKPVKPAAPPPPPPPVQPAKPTPPAAREGAQ